MAAQEGSSEQALEPRWEHYFRVNVHTAERTPFMVECLFSMTPFPRSGVPA